MPVTYPVIFTAAASAELIEAQDWYEREAPGSFLKLLQRATISCIGLTSPNSIRVIATSVVVSET